MILRDVSILDFRVTETETGEPCSLGDKYSNWLDHRFMRAREPVNNDCRRRKNR